MKVLVTGATGFVASHLIPELLGHGHEVFATCHAGNQIAAGGHSVACLKADINNYESLSGFIKDVQPNAVIHLAGISHVVKALEDKGTLSEVNIVGTHTLSRALSNHVTGQVTVLNISSSLVYGRTPEAAGFSEASLPHPETSYGASKLAGEYVVQSYADEKFKPYVVRPFNHIGPGQREDFVCAGLARRIVEAPVGGTIAVGNLETFRDFTDVRDVVRAYRLIIEEEPDERLFVIGSGVGRSIRSVLDELVAVSRKKIEVKVDRALYRQQDPAKIVADPRLIQEVLGWHPEIPFQKTIQDIYEDAVRRFG